MHSQAGNITNQLPELIYEINVQFLNMLDHSDFQEEI